MALTTVAIGMAALSGVTGAVGAMSSAAAAESQAEYNAAIADRNAKLTEQDRQRAIRTAQIEADDKRRENRRQLASIRAAYGTSGIEMSGTPLEVLSDSAIEMALDERRIEYKGQVESRSLALEAIGYEEEASAERAAGANAKTAGYINAVGSLAQAGTDIASLSAED